MNCLDLISRSLRRIGVLAAGQKPREVEAVDALQVLIGLYARLISDGALGELTEVVPLGDHTARENERVIRAHLEVDNITLPETINDCGRERPPHDTSVVMIIDRFSNTSRSYLYDGQNAQWVDIQTLGLTSEAPLASRDPLGLTCYLATELADEYGQQASDLTNRNAATFRMGLTTNWSAPKSDVKGTYF